MKQVILYGALAEKFGKYHRFAAKNAGECIRALRANFPGFESYMCGAHAEGIGFRVFVGTGSIHEAKQVNNPSSDREVIRITPVIMGSGALGKILIGAVLIAAAIVTAPFTAGTSLAFTANVLGSMGAALVLGGVSQLLSSPPDVSDSQPKRKNSAIFTGPANTTTQGGAVGIGYGRMIIGSTVISAGIEVNEG